MSSIVRQRRYVSASPGAYPAPVPPRRAATPSPTPAEPDLGAEIEASLKAATSVEAPSGPAAEPRAQPAATEFQQAPVLPHEEHGSPAMPSTEELEPSAPATDPSPSDEDTARESGSSKPRSATAGMIVGGLVGAALGVLAGLLLLALTQGPDGLGQQLADPAALLGKLTNPLALWQGVADWLIRMSAVLVGGGFLLLGIGWGGRLGSRAKS